MRVAVHHPERTEPDGTAVPASISAFRQGRIEAFTNPLTGETTQADEVAKLLLEAAKVEYPDLEVTLQYLHDNGDGTSTWKDGPPAAPAPPGEQHAQELTAEQGQVAQ